MASASAHPYLCLYGNPCKTRCMVVQFNSRTMLSKLHDEEICRVSANKDVIYEVTCSQQDVKGSWVPSQDPHSFTVSLQGHNGFSHWTCQALVWDLPHLQLRHSRRLFVKAFYNDVFRRMRATSVSYDALIYIHFRATQPAVVRCSLYIVKSTLKGYFGILGKRRETASLTLPAHDLL